MAVKGDGYEHACMREVAIGGRGGVFEALCTVYEINIEINHSCC